MHYTSQIIADKKSHASSAIMTWQLNGWRHRILRKWRSANNTLNTVRSVSTLIFSNSRGPGTKIPKLTLTFPS